MLEVAWFATGIAAAVLGRRLLHRSETETAAPLVDPASSDPQLAPTEPLSEDPPPRDDGDGDEHEDALTTMVTTVGSDLAGLASAIHGATERLFEALGDPAQVQQGAGDLWSAANRLQRFGQKLLAFYPSPGNDPVAPLDVTDVAESLRADCLEEHMGSIEVDLHSAPDLPAALSNHHHLSHALRFLLEGLLSLAPNAQHIFVGLRRHAGDEAPAVQVEMRVAATPDHAPTSFAAQRLELGYRAAQNLMHRCGGRVSLSHAVGGESAAFLVMPATDESPEASEAACEPDRAMSEHSYGGVLVLEADPVLRTVIATELRMSGRSFSTCADGASAQALLEATPERFELVIAEQDARLLPGDVLIHDALTRFEELKALLLVDGVTPMPPWMERHSERFAVLPKPFQPSDLRDRLSQLVASSRTSRQG